MSRMIFVLLVCTWLVGCGKNSADDANKNLKPVTGKVEDLNAGAVGSSGPKGTTPGQGKAISPP